MKLSGFVYLVQDEIQIKEFRKRNVVLEHCDRGYTHYITFEFHQSQCSLLDKFKKGDSVLVEFSVNGRKWIDKEGEEKFFNSLQAWKIIPYTPED